MSNNYARESITFGENESIPSQLRGEQMISDELMNSAGIYSKADIEEARFAKFSRFGRVLDPYGKVNPGREYLFFVKPDLHICKTPGSDDIYNISGGSTSSYASNGLTLNPQLDNNPYFRYLIGTHPDVVKQLQYSLNANSSSNNDPFCKLLSFTASSNLPLDSSSAKTLDTPSTIFGTTYNYLQDSEASDNAYSFSLEFVDDKYLDTYHFFKAYSEYHIARKSGLVTPPTMQYYQYKRLHNTMGIYKFVVAEDMETILYWAYLWGVYPTSCPRDAFQDPNFADGLTFSVNFEAAFIEDMNPAILGQFNNLMSGQVKDKSKYLPVVIQDRSSSSLTKSNLSYSPKKTGREDTISGYTYPIGPSSHINGTLPRAALVDETVIGNEKQKFRLRWYE